MNSKSLKTTIQERLEFAKFTKNFEKIVCGALTYSMLEARIAIVPSIQNQIANLAAAYISQYKKFVQDLSGKYTCYTELETMINGWNIVAFQDITESQIKQIVDKYNNKKEIPTFSTAYYSSEMYGLTNISVELDARLRNIHKTVFSPIVKHYRTFYNIPVQLISIKNTLMSNPGKVFEIKINGIPPSKILSDIQNDIFGIKTYVYNTKLTPNDSVEIILR